MSAQWETLLVPAWQRLGGGELRHGRGQAFWRNGDGYNVALYTANGGWHDYVTDTGGGVLDLVETVLGCARPAALQWLEAEGFIEPHHFSLGKRREYARCRERLAGVALEFSLWRDDLTYVVNYLKLSTSEAGDLAGLERAAQLCDRLENGPLEPIVRLFVEQRKVDPEGVAHLIEAGRLYHDESRRIAAAVVLILVRADELEQRYAA